MLVLARQTMLLMILRLMEKLFGRRDRDTGPAPIDRAPVVACGWPAIQSAERERAAKARATESGSLDNHSG
jgi:hypothetical protein